MWLPTSMKCRSCKKNNRDSILYVWGREIAQISHISMSLVTLTRACGCWRNSRFYICRISASSLITQAGQGTVLALLGRFFVHLPTAHYIFYSKLVSWVFFSCIRLCITVESLWAPSLCLIANPDIAACIRWFPVSASPHFRSTTITSKGIYGGRRRSLLMRIYTSVRPSACSCTFSFFPFLLLLFFVFHLMNSMVLLDLNLLLLLSRVFS